MKSLIKPLIDFLAMILFFITYFYTRNIYTATEVAIIVALLQTAVIWFKFKKLSHLQIISTLLIIIMGGATIIFHNALFIKWKPTILFWLIAIILIISMLMGKNALKLLLSKEFTLPEVVWRNLVFIWSGFYFILGIINIVVAYHYDEQTWVTYKTFGSMGLIIVFFIVQFIYLAKYLPTQEQK